MIDCLIDYDSVTELRAIELVTECWSMMREIGSVGLCSKTGVTRETRVLCSKLCLAGSFMLKYDTSSPPPISPQLLVNIPGRSFLKEMLENNDVSCAVLHGS